MTKKHIILLLTALIITSFYSCKKPAPLSEFQKNIKDLSDKDPEIRAGAAYKLGETGDHLLIPELLPVLLKALNDTDLEVRRAVINSLFEVRAVRAIPELMLLANNKDEEVSIRCDALTVSVILWIRNKTNYDLLPNIIKLYHDADEQLRISVLESLIESRDHRAFEIISNAVKDKSSEVRIAALNSLLRMEDVSGLPAVISCLDDSDPNVRNIAVQVLIIGGESSIPYLKEMLNDKEYFVVINSAVILNKLGNESGIPVIKNMLKDKNPKVCLIAAMVLFEEIGDKSGIPVLIELLNNEDDAVKITAISLLKMGNTKAVNALIPVLTDKNPEIQTQAALTLGEIGNVSCVPFLISALKNDTDSAFRVAIVQALGQLPGKASLEALKGTLYDHSLSVRISSVKSLSRVGNSDIIPLLNTILLKEDEPVKIKMDIIKLYKANDYKQTSNILAKLLKNEDSDLCAISTSILGEWGEKAYFNDIKELLKSKDPKIRANAILSLSKMGDSSVALSIANHLKDKTEDKQIRELSAICIGQIGNKEVLPILINVVKDKKDIKSVRNSAIHALGSLKDKNAVPVLIDILKNDKDLVLVSSATQSLGFIKDKTASAFIIPLLNSDINTIRLTALGALTELKDSTTVPALMKLLLKKITTDKTIDYETELICELLGDIKDKRAIPLLKEIWKHKSSTLKPSVAKALYQLGETYTIQYIRELATENENIRLQVWAIRTLGELGDKSALETVVGGLKSSDYSVREEAVIALGSLGNESSTVILEKMLNKEDVLSDVNIFESIARLENKSERIINMLKNENDIQVRIKVMEALGRLQNKSALPFLDEIKENDISWEMRKKASETIKQINAVES
ncbi:MAG: HEAT repeat domain-containing protein [Bacteroidales bacterium]|nr:HEAT repeat domain-containing protein [Bacteroidales bacterium]